jgi:hypothetical protein
MELRLDPPEVCEPGRHPVARLHRDQAHRRAGDDQLSGPQHLAPADQVVDQLLQGHARFTSDERALFRPDRDPYLSRAEPFDSRAPIGLPTSLV